jgi:hypothetical protein
MTISCQRKDSYAFNEAIKVVSLGWLQYTYEHMSTVVSNWAITDIYSDVIFWIL